MIDCPACHVPPWGGAAATLLAAAHREGWRPGRVQAFTGQREQLFGYPVLVNSSALAKCCAAPRFARLRAGRESFPPSNTGIPR